jgi:hypothetical protein
MNIGVGDWLIYVGNDNISYTKNKFYVITEISLYHGYFFDDNHQRISFKLGTAVNDKWSFISRTDLLKNKIKKIKIRINASR